MNSGVTPRGPDDDAAPAGNAEARATFTRTEPNGRLTELLTYWSKQRGERAMPARRDLDPLDIPSHLLPYVFLVDVVGHPARFRRRLLGTAIVLKEGYDTTGRWLDEVVKESIRAEVLGHHLETVTTRAPTCYAAWFIGDDGKTYQYQRVLAPLSTDGQSVDMLFGGTTFD